MSTVTTNAKCLVAILLAAAGCLAAAACATLDGPPPDGVAAPGDTAAAVDGAPTPTAGASPSLAERLAVRPAGCPEPLPGNMMIEAAEAYAGKCLMPVVFGEFSGPGFMGGGLIDDDVSDDIFIYWYGELDPASQALIDQAALDGVHVEVRYVPYSEDQLRSATVAISQALGAEGILWSTIGMGFERIEVTIFDAQAVPTAQEVAQAAAGDIPVTIVVSDVRIKTTGALEPSGYAMVGWSGPAVTED